MYTYIYQPLHVLRSFSLPLVHFVNHGVIMSYYVLLCVTSCREHIIMNKKDLIPCGQVSIYFAMKPYFTKHCSPSCDEQCKANASCHRCKPCRAGGIGPAAPVLAGPLFSQGNNRISFLQKQVINKALV